MQSTVSTYKSGTAQSFANTNGDFYDDGYDNNDYYDYSDFEEDNNYSFPTHENEAKLQRLQRGQRPSP